MSRQSPLPDWFDREAPVSPSEDQWATLDPSQREAVRAALPFVVEHDFMSEGDAHARAVLEASEQLESFFGGSGPPKRPFYIGRSVMVHYPVEPGFAPDLFVVFDVPDHDRTSYVVLAEGRRLDFAFEVISEGDRAKDLVRNVAKFARLGISEYFVLDLNRRRLHGFRLSEGGGVYETLVPQLGRFESKTLGLRIGLEAGRARFFVGDALLPTARELRARLEFNLQLAVDGQAAEAERAEAEAQKAEAEAKKAEAETQRALMLEERNRELEARIRELEAKLYN